MMIETPQEMRALIGELAGATLSLSTLAVLFETGIAEQLVEPRTLDELAAKHPWLGRQRIERCLGLAAAFGVVANDGGHYRLAPGAMPLAAPQTRAAILGDLRAPLLQAQAFYDRAARKEPTTGWRHTDPAILQTQGDGSAMLAPVMKNMIVPQLGDLGERMARPGAKFLDVGVGVASLAIAMARLWPELRIVGVDEYDVPLTIARDHIARAKLGDRIELRQTRIDTFGDEGAYELAWLPSFFIAPDKVAAATARVSAALKPGGWMIFGAFATTGATKACAIVGMLADLWGGRTFSPAEVEPTLATAGLANVRILPGPGGVVLAVGQRA
jgi:2-polyprenyl-3-methyl-5-hydroxy-6-metoxy-1,4-benzoquinol methylase